MTTPNTISFNFTQINSNIASWNSEVNYSSFCLTISNMDPHKTVVDFIYILDYSSSKTNQEEEKVTQMRQSISKHVSYFQ